MGYNSRAGGELVDLCGVRLIRCFVNLSRKTLNKTCNREDKFLMNSKTLSVSELQHKARQILPVIEKYRSKGNQQRDLAPEIFQAISDAGLFRLYQPSAWGGAELDPRDFWSVQAVLAEACLSTAWVQGVLSVQSFLMALFNQQAQNDVWGETPNTLISSSFQPTGKVTQVEGGYNISGHWTFSSGSSFANWVLVGGLIFPEGEGKPPQMGLFLVPRSDYEIKDTWHTFGLRATGSNDVVIEQAFVPQHRLLLPGPGILPNVVPAEGLSSLYQLPWLYIFTGGVSYLGIGGCRGALNDFIDVAKTRRAIITGKAVKEDPEVHRAIAKTQGALTSAKVMYEQHIANMWGYIDRQEVMPESEGLLQRSQMMAVMRDLTAHTDTMRLLLGGRGVREDSPLTQRWLDMNAACAHPGNDPRAIEMMLGQTQLSLD